MKKKMVLSQAQASKRIWFGRLGLLALLAVVMLLIGYTFRARDRATYTVTEQIRFPIGNRPLEIKLIQGLDKSLQEHPHAKYFILYWQDASSWAMKYDRSARKLTYITGDVQHNCREYIYDNVTPEYIRHIAIKNENIRLLNQFGCTVTKFDFGGFCE